MGFINQSWTLVKKDILIIAQRRWLSTSIRAFIFPVILTIVLCYIRHWTATGGYYGIGSPQPLISFPDALSQTGSTRPNVVIINNGFSGGDIGSVIDELSNTIRNSGKQLHVIPDASQIQTICPSSNGGVSTCYGAVEFLGSPDHGPPGQIWNYTLYADASLGTTVDVRTANNDLQLYTLPFQHAVDAAIATTHGGSGLTNK